MWLRLTLLCLKVIGIMIITWMSTDTDFFLLCADIILMTIVGLTVVFALVIVTVGYVCYKR